MSGPTLYLDGRVAVHAGDCMAVVKTLADNSIDACVTDPPYSLTSIVKRFGKTSLVDKTDTSDRSRKGADGYARLAKGFMGKAWDNGSTAFAVDFWAEVWRVLKPGAHVVAFGGTRTYHRLACAIEDAGFECRDAVMWHYGTGFPKSHDVSKGIDKASGAVREFGDYRTPAHAIKRKPHQDRSHEGYHRPWQNDPESVEATLRTSLPATDAARAWEGWGTALKPATEIIFVGRKPLSEGTVAANVLKWNCGALNIDACRVGFENDAPNPATNPLFRKENGYANGNASDANSTSFRVKKDGSGERPASRLGRWPANCVLSWPEDQYALRRDVTAEQKRELFGWLSENA